MSDMSDLSGYVNDARWAGEPMVEQCDTTDFFEEKKVYREIPRNNTPEPLRQQFWCKSVFVHPSTKILYAIGLFRTAANRPWNAYPVPFVLTNWKQGWEEIQLPTQENA